MIINLHMNKIITPAFNILRFFFVKNSIIRNSFKSLIELFQNLDLGDINLLFT